MFSKKVFTCAAALGQGDSHEASAFSGDEA
jgi:hypothetical protein